MSNHQYFAIYKPYGYLSQFVNNQNTRRNKKLLGELGDFPNSTMAIGRLDEKSEGLLFLTTDGLFSEYIRSKKIEKEYYVQVAGTIDDEAIKELTNGVVIRVNAKPYKTKRAKAKYLKETPIFPVRSRKERSDNHGPTSWLSITISEGKFRQVRKMTASLGYPCIRLVRIRIGNHFLEDLKPNETQIIDPDDFK